MRHNIKGKKLNRTSAHRKSMLANMAVSLIIHEQIKTTLSKAKALSPYIQKIITKSKNPTLHNRKIILSKIKSQEATKKLIDILGTRYQNRFGGYVKIVKAGYRYGDMTKMAYITLMDNEQNSV